MKTIDSKKDLIYGDSNKSSTVPQRSIDSDPNVIHEAYEMKLREESLRYHFVAALLIPIV
jgi:hypothetical protein